jgi:hypothetical protein
MHIWKNSLDTTIKFRKDKVCSIPDNSFMYKTVSLPGERVFVIGGAKDVIGN